MKPNEIMRIFEDTAYVRMGGTEEELKTARYLQQKVAALGLSAEIESFPVDMADMEEGKSYKDYLNLDSVQVLHGCKLEASMKDVQTGERFQFVRNGYFCKDSKYDNTYNRIVTLKDSYQVK